VENIFIFIDIVSAQCRIVRVHDLIKALYIYTVSLNQLFPGHTILLSKICKRATHRIAILWNLRNQGCHG